MIIVRSPLRVSFGGGGTDLPSYYRKHTGFVVAAAITRYVYVTISEAFWPQIRLKYSKLEEVESVDQIQHPIIREAMKLTGVKGPYLDIVSLSDIPAGTGLGSSGSFTTALLRALYALNHRFISPEDLAEQACHIEIDVLDQPVGKQDQYISSFGGITSFEFLPDDRVVVKPLTIPAEALANLEDSLVLFFTDSSRSASQILRDQDTRSKQDSQDIRRNLDFMKQLGLQSRDALVSGNLPEFAKLMAEHWEHKKQRSPGISNPRIDELYDLARSNGAVSGKLVGAGGGGFLMLYTEDKTRLRRAMRAAGLREVRFQFDFTGTTTIVQS